MLLPAFAVIALVVGLPLADVLWLSVHEGRGIQTGDFVGLEHYAEILTDPLYLGALVRTLVWVVVTVAICMALGVAVALLLLRLPRWAGILSVLVLLPWAMPRVASGIIWKWIFNDQYGVANWLLTTIGFSQFEGFNWFAQGETAFVAIGAASIWQRVPFLAIALYGALSTLDPEILEAARLDGASAWRTLVSIRLPLIAPVLLILIVLSSISSFNSFDYIFVMTTPPGGPNHGTEVISILTYITGFGLLEQGRAAAIAVTSLLILTALTAVYYRLTREERA
ncbi:carbohydrate ABC transporter permease [Agromyces aerolatus]|uniref:carbohydrate ABC transporter permease n=1 Tax=Agromyces sp. LY-1074 TaxID=3074080 RepID=UPI002856F765|nr:MULTISPECIES: sugar ABC transporter permease [unclassified Agromyces]MDR5701372.1 sugar ABC transporter permease [Agromyces sp. LY-1074]MDR5706839.1 sugar ABC transporter permease [Agromyces sp. LY-1358]